MILQKKHRHPKMRKERNPQLSAVIREAVVQY
jgi:hypothetical protein